MDGDVPEVGSACPVSKFSQAINLVIVVKFVLLRYSTALFRIKAIAGVVVAVIELVWSVPELRQPRLLRDAPKLSRPA